ncbi:hypothetical protein [Streptomyces sp. NPDC093060]|uniref:hypothetical protein n=1 Tax=Streptomyces sp. NPDC093060 TaxID=3366019 RepID=UPI00380B7379
MTTKPKARADEQAAAPASTEVEAPQCGAPHQLAALAHLHCQEPAGHDGPQGRDQALHPHRALEDGTLYVWG